MIKVWHPYTAWECFTHGMWDICGGVERRRLLKRAIAFTGDADLYGSWMMRVIHEWPTSCEHHLTDTGSNRRAYIGHAAACMAIQCPEDITRKAWGYLSDRQQDEANHKADLAIEAWERVYASR